MHSRNGDFNKGALDQVIVELNWIEKIEIGSRTSYVQMGISFLVIFVMAWLVIRKYLFNNNKYQAIKAVHDFVPTAVETLGPIKDEGMIFLRELGGRLSTASRDPRETSFLFQRVSDCMQRANAIAFRGSFSNFCEDTDV